MKKKSINVIVLVFLVLFFIVPVSKASLDEVSAKSLAEELCKADFSIYAGKKKENEYLGDYNHLEEIFSKYKKLYDDKKKLKDEKLYNKVFNFEDKNSVSRKIFDAAEFMKKYVPPYTGSGYGAASSFDYLGELKKMQNFVQKGKMFSGKGTDYGGQSDVDKDELEAQIEAQKKKKVYPKYKMPSISSVDREQGNIDDIITDGDEFIKSGNEGDTPVNIDDIKLMSNRIYNILFDFAVGIAVIIGLVIGIKLMLASVNEKAEAKKMMWVYLVGCIASFGAFGIWKILIKILEKL